MLIIDALFLTLILQNFVSVQNYEYCKNEVKICRGKERRHIICFPEQVEQASEFKKYYIMTDPFREWILYWHNFYRNQLACGLIKGSDGPLPTAAKMRELTWDYELEYIASQHARRCNMKHDKCRNTVRFPYSGQNLAYHKTGGNPRKPMAQAFSSISKWFVEHKDTPMAIIAKNAEIEGVKIGHFTVMSADKVGRVGCSLTFCKSFPKDKRAVFNYITCNYDYTNIPGTAVYAAGPPTSKCQSKFHVPKSSNFSCLCASPFK